MSRYNQTQLKYKNKKKYYATTNYEKVPEKNDDMYFIATEGDRCDNLATRFYGAGTSLRIPKTTKHAKGY